MTHDDLPPETQIKIAQDVIRFRKGYLTKGLIEVKYRLGTPEHAKFFWLNDRLDRAQNEWNLRQICKELIRLSDNA